MRFFEEFSIFEVFVFFFWARRLDKKWSPSSTLHFPLLREGCGISQKSTVPARPDQSLYVTMHPTDFPPCVSTPGGRSAHGIKTHRTRCGIARGIPRTFYLPRGTITSREKWKWNFFLSRKNSSEKIISKNFPILLIISVPRDLERWLMVFSGTTKSALSRFGSMGRARSCVEQGSQKTWFLLTAKYGSTGRYWDFGCFAGSFVM